MHLIIQDIQKKKYASFQKFAEENKLGLWKMKFDFPWIWRKKNR